jgi:hypothetical protein
MMLSVVERIVGNVVSCLPLLGCRLTVGRLTLDQVVGVRIPAPQPSNTSGNSGGVFLCTRVPGGSFNRPIKPPPSPCQPNLEAFSCSLFSFDSAVSDAAPDQLGVRISRGVGLPDFRRNQARRVDRAGPHVSAHNDKCQGHSGRDGSSETESLLPEDPGHVQVGITCSGMICVMCHVWS